MVVNAQSLIVILIQTSISFTNVYYSSIPFMILQMKVIFMNHAKKGDKFMFFRFIMLSKTMILIQILYEKVSKILAISKHRIHVHCLH